MVCPDFYADVPVIHTRDRLAEFLGASSDGLLDYRYEDAVRVCGHSCPTVASAFLAVRAALAALYPDGPAERGGVAVAMPAPEDEGTTGVTAQVVTLVTGAAADNGFHGIAGKFVRQGLLTYAARPDGQGAIRMRRLDTGATVAVQVDPSGIPADPAMRELFGPALDDHAEASVRKRFASLWQDRVRRLLVEHADDPEVVYVKTLVAA